MCRNFASDACHLAHLAPCQAAIDFVEWDVAVSQKFLQRELAVADFVVGGNLLDDSASIEATQIAVYVGKDFLFCLFFQYYLAAEGRIGEATLNLFLDVARMSAYKSLKAVFITELGTRMAYKVEYGKMVLAFVQTESSTKLLEEDRGTLGRTKEENGVDLRNVHTLVEEVYNEEIIDFACLKMLLDEGAMVVVVVARKHIRMQSGKRELGVHESCVLLVYTEAKCTNLVKSAVSDVLLHLLEDEPCTEIVLGVDTR